MVAKNDTKQRVDGHFVLVWMASLMHDMIDNLSEEAVTTFASTVHWLENSRFATIPCPHQAYNNDTKLLVVVLERQKEASTRTLERRGEEHYLTEQAYDDCHKALSRMTQGAFKEVVL